MDINTIIGIVENNKKTLAINWKDEVKKAKFTKTYHQLEDDEIIRRVTAVFEHMILWLKTGASNDEAERYFENVGKDRMRQGFPLSEVNYALYLEKKVFWNLICCHSEIVSSFKTNEALELMTLLSNYFDLGSFYITQGYFYEFFGELDEGAVYSKDQLKEFLMKGVPDHKMMRSDEFVWRHV